MFNVQNKRGGGVGEEGGRKKERTKSMRLCKKDGGKKGTQAGKTQLL